MSRNTLQLRSLYEWDDLDKFHFSTSHQRSYITNGRVNEALLQEGLTAGLAKDALQWILGASAEYGLGAIGLAAGGAPVAAGPAVETGIDALFAADSIKSAVSAVGAATAIFGGEWASKLARLWDAVQDMVKGGLGSLGGLYDNIVTVIREGLSLIAPAADLMEQAAAALQEGVEKLVQSMVDAIVQGIKALIPEATVGVTLAAAIRTALSALASNAFTIVAGIVDAIGPLKSFLLEDGVAAQFFSDLYDKVIELTIAMAERIEERGWIMATLGGVPGLLVKAFGPDGFRMLADKIKGLVPVMMDVIDTVVQILMPALFAGLAIYQILMKEDWKKGGVTNKMKEIGAEIIADGRIPTLANLLLEAEDEDKDPDDDFPDIHDPVEVEVTGNAAKDLETAFNAGPEGVRAFMDANKNPEVIEILTQAAEEYDGSDPDDKIAIGDSTPISVSDLAPTQQFIDLMQSVSFPLGSANILDGAITSKTTGAPGAISVSGDAVLDGHHRWSGVYAITPDGNISAKDFQFSGGVKDKLAAAQLAVAAVNKGGKHPSQGGGAATDIIGKGKEAIVAMIDTNKGQQTDPDAPGTLLNDEMIQAVADGNHPAIEEWAGLTGEEEFISLADSAAGFENDPIRKAIADKVATNLAGLPQPLAGAPASREDMPQLDHPIIGGKAGLASIEAGLPAGEFNVHPPFTKESRLSQDDLVIERWQKLAGLLKG